MQMAPSKDILGTRIGHKKAIFGNVLQILKPICATCTPVPGHHR